jgi:hypothetical protein
MRIQVIIYIQKPLERGRSLTIVGKAHWVNFKYKNLPVFCFNCGRIVHGENGCPARTCPDQKKEWKVWLRVRAEKPRKQGLEQWCWTDAVGISPRAIFSAKHQAVAGIKQRWKISRLGETLSLIKHLYKVSTINNSKLMQFLPKIDVCEVNAGIIEHQVSTGNEGVTGDSQGKNYQSYERGKAAQLEKMGDPSLFKWVQKEVTGPLNTDPKSAGRPG